MTAIQINRGLCALLLGCVIIAAEATAAEFDRSHAPFDAVLKQFVRNARVDYAELAAQPQDLNRYLDQIAAVSMGEFTKWSEKQQMAFLINAYNACTLRLIIDHYPLKSVKDIGGWFSGPWDQPVVKLFGKTMDLNTVEHGILRKDYAEPRIHFALVCAAKGCPPLRREAYAGARLEEPLDDQAKQFLTDTTKNRIVASERTVYLSPIFKWYGDDFDKKSGSVLAALKAWWPGQPVAGYEDFQICYTDYDWSLNAQSK
jgi:hypothetical protein